MIVSDLDSPIIDDIQRDEPIIVDELEMLRGLVPFTSRETQQKLTLEFTTGTQFNLRY